MGQKESKYKKEHDLTGLTFVRDSWVLVLLLGLFRYLTQNKHWIKPEITQLLEHY